MCFLYGFFVVFFFKQKTAYEMRISDWSSDVCSSDLRRRSGKCADLFAGNFPAGSSLALCPLGTRAWLSSAQFSPCRKLDRRGPRRQSLCSGGFTPSGPVARMRGGNRPLSGRSEEHTSELQSIMRISYAVFCLKKKK